MRLHRFYIDPEHAVLKQDFWLHDYQIISQWRKVLRYRAGQEVVLFDGADHERLYKIVELNDKEAHLQLITDMHHKLPTKDIYLAWSLLKKDKNDWVLQKCTELGVNHFIPILAEHCEKTGFNEDRAKKILIEAAEQCGRGNIPTVREPIGLDALLDEFVGKLPVLACEQAGDQKLDQNLETGVVIIGPEGGWSDSEITLFKQYKATLINIGDFTHRAETASIVAATKLLS